MLILALFLQNSYHFVVNKTKALEMVTENNVFKIDSITKTTQ